MSHFWQHGKTKFVGNSDLSGDITITNKAGERFDVNGRDLIDFIAGRMIGARISHLEDMDAETFFGVSNLPPRR